MKTNIGKKFLAVIRKSFPTSNPLSEIFNKSIIKISYCCLPNIKSIIDCHNKEITNKKPERLDNSETKCNCRDKSNCPLNGKCLEDRLIYKATVETDNSKESYVGLTTN